MQSPLDDEMRRALALSLQETHVTDWGRSEAGPLKEEKDEGAETDGAEAEMWGAGVGAVLVSFLT